MQSKFLFLFFLLLIFGCSYNKNNNSSKKVFKYNESAGITSLDPAYAKDQANIWACNQLFNGLVQLNDKLEIEPCIAKHWIISDDGKTYTFYLRNDVFFHNTFNNKNKPRKVNATDFVYSFNRITNPDNASPGAWVFNNIDTDVKTNKPCFYAINDTIFEIKLKNPFPPFLGLLSMQYCSVVPKEIVEKFGKDFRKNPIGTGPFLFKMWNEGRKLVLLKNENYFEKSGNDKLPYIDAVSITFVVDKQSVFLEFVKGNLDFMSGIDASYKDELLTKTGTLNSKYKEKFRLEALPYLNTEYLGFLVDSSISSLKNNPLNNKKIRQAINYGFDRKKMMTYLRNNVGKPAIYGFVPEGLQSFDTSEIKGYEYNPEKVRKLLLEAGYPNGIGLPEITISTTSSYLDLCKFIQQQLNESGFKIKIDVNPAGTLREMIAKSKATFFRGSWIADYPDPENYLSLFYSKNFCPKGPNYTHYSNKKYDYLFEEAQKTIDSKKRNILYKKMDKLIIEDAVVVPLYYDEVLRFIQNNISGLGNNPMNLLSLKKVKKQ